MSRPSRFREGHKEHLNGLNRCKNSSLRDHKQRNNDGAGVAVVVTILADESRCYGLPLIIYNPQNIGLVF